MQRLVIWKIRKKGGGGGDIKPAKRRKRNDRALLYCQVETVFHDVAPRIYQGPRDGCANS